MKSTMAVAVSALVSVLAIVVVSGCSPSVTDDEVTSAIARRVGDDPSRQAWVLYKGETPIAAFWNSVDLSVGADATTDLWLRGNRAGCESLLASLTADANAVGQTKSSYRCAELN